MSETTQKRAGIAKILAFRQIVTLLLAVQVEVTPVKGVTETVGQSVICMGRPRNGAGHDVQIALVWVLLIPDQRCPESIGEVLGRPAFKV
jgi:hypothetical protein